MINLVAFSRLFALFLAFVGFVHAAEDGTATTLPAGTITVPAGVKAADVQQAIVVAATGRGWTVKDRSDSKVVLFLEKGGWRAQLTCLYDDKEIKIESNSGKVDRKGFVAKPAVPESWVKFIKQDVTKLLATKAAAK